MSRDLSRENDQDKSRLFKLTAFCGTFAALGIVIVFIDGSPVARVLGLCLAAFFGVGCLGLLRMLAKPSSSYVQILPNGLRRETIVGVEFHPWSCVSDLKLVNNLIYFTDTRRQNPLAAAFRPPTVIAPPASLGRPEDVLAKMYAARERAVPRLA